MSYSEKLKDPRWQKKRLKVFEYAQFRCQICGSKDKTLHVHHSYYTRGKEPWQYPTGSLICVCEKCHEKLHPKAATPDCMSEDFKPVSKESAKKHFDEMRRILSRSQ